jgi:hypothetical protein
MVHNIEKLKKYGRLAASPSLCRGIKASWFLRPALQLAGIAGQAQCIGAGTAIRRARVDVHKIITCLSTNRFSWLTAELTVMRSKQKGRDQ